jgi:hypothetical protein
MAATFVLPYDKADLPPLPESATAIVNLMLVMVRLFLDVDRVRVLATHAEALVAHLTAAIRYYVSISEEERAALWPKLGVTLPPARSPEPPADEGDVADLPTPAVFETFPGEEAAAAQDLLCLRLDKTGIPFSPGARVHRNPGVLTVTVFFFAFGMQMPRWTSRRRDHALAGVPEPCAWPPAAQTKATACFGAQNGPPARVPKNNKMVCWRFG